MSMVQVPANGLSNAIAAVEILKPIRPASTLAATLRFN
jgi:hypothetical protein